MPTKLSKNPAEQPARRGRSIALPKAEKPTQEDRARVAETAAQKLVATVWELKDVAGTGTDDSAKGDPRIPARREAVAVLLAAKKDAPDKKAELQKLSEQVQADVKWVLAADRTDYKLEDMPDPNSSGSFGSKADPATDPFWWSKNGMNRWGETADKLFQKRVDVGAQRAADFEQGILKYFPVTGDNGIAGVSALDEVCRARALADVLLQFRSPAENTVSTTKGSSAEKRIDREGPAMVAEKRLVLSSLQLGARNDTQLRQLALVREMMLAHPASNGNGIFDARNAVGSIYMSEGKSYGAKDNPVAWVREEVPPGATASPYESIHHNFSKDTPGNIEAMFIEWLLPVGPKEERANSYATLADALKASRNEDFNRAREKIASLKDKSPEVHRALQKKLRGVDDAGLGDALVSFLSEVSQRTYGTQAVESNIQMAARLFRAVCQSRPTVDTIEKHLFQAGSSWPEVADVVAELRAGDKLGTLRELGEARLSLRNALIRAKSGYEREQLIDFDGMMNRVTLEELGAAVDRVGNLGTDAKKAEALVALGAALKACIAMGLHALRSDSDEAAKKGQSIKDVSKKIDAVLVKGETHEDEYRALMAEAKVAVARTVQNIRWFFDDRAVNIAADGVNVDPEFADQFVKQTGLHYATALAEKGMRVGLRETISDRSIANVKGMRVLNSIGPVVFPSVVVAPNAADLSKLNLPKDALAIVYKSDEKKMRMAGGLVVDTKDAPGGNSHLNMYAMNNGIPVIALPELSKAYGTFFKNAEQEGGLFVDDSKGEFKMMTVALARELGLVSDANFKSLLPGTNRKIQFLVPNATFDGFDVAGSHETHCSDARPTRNIELYVPQSQVKGMGRKSVSFTELASLERLGRHLAGEKGVVLALMKADPELSKYIPDGSVVTTGRVEALLDEAGLLDAWKDVWAKDPVVGQVDDSNFLQSAFYTDGAYRDGLREKLSQATTERLTRHLIAVGAEGKKQLTAAGVALYEELRSNPALAGSKNWIARSSFTGEDRPGKSGAGQYESFPNLKTDVSRVEGVIGVIASAWDAAPVENNVAEEVNLRRIMPSVVVQDCLKPELSGVAISRNVDSGARGQVSVQLVKGFGGGVEGGKAQEGVITAAGMATTVIYPGAPEGLASADALKELRELVLKVEKFFNSTIEPGKGHAVDMEVARVGDGWHIVQARVILLDK